MSEVVTLEDQFFTLNVRLGKAVFMCNPVAKLPFGSTDPFPPLVDSDAHLTCYRLSNVDRTVNGPVVSVTDQFGARTWNVKRPKVLCLPSTKKVLP